MKPGNSGGGKDPYFRCAFEEGEERNKALSAFLKVLANSGSYGLFVELNQEKKKQVENLVEMDPGDVLLKARGSDRYYRTAKGIGAHGHSRA